MLEAQQVEELLTKAAAQGNLRHVVYVSSVGAEKAGFQFSLDSLGGNLEKKKAAEQAVRRLARTLGFSFSVMRVGALGPSKAGEEGVLLEPADSLSGATSLPTAAQAVVQALALPSALNATFSVVNTKGARGGMARGCAIYREERERPFSRLTLLYNAQARPRRTRTGATACSSWWGRRCCGCRSRRRTCRTCAFRSAPGRSSSWRVR